MGQMKTRRNVLTGFAAATAFHPICAHALAEPSLAALAATKGIRFGSELGLTEIKDPRLVKIINRETALLVPGNEFKLYSILPDGPDLFRFEQGDQFLAFAKTIHKSVRGHTLVWMRDEATPDWLRHYDFGRQPKIAAEAFLRQYIYETTQHFGPDITSWDVVNEAVDATTGELRNSVFTRILGLDAVRIAFEAARESLPYTPLIYNDYMDWRMGRELHRQGVITLLRWLQDRHVSVNVLGIQSHIRTAETPFDPENWGIFLKNVQALGIDMAVTEFDVRDQLAKGTIPQRDLKVAEAAKLYLEQILSFTEVKEVLTWGMSDKYAYVPPDKKRADGLLLRLAPYDHELKPKLLRETIANAFRTAPMRQPGFRITA